jgi:hypothetical protein
MASFEIDGEELVVRLARSEKALGLLRDLRVPLAAVTNVEVVADGRAAVRGWRTGLGGPQRLIGTWRTKGNTQYVCVRRGQPTVKTTLIGQRYQTVLIGSDDADRMVAAIDAVCRRA